MNSLEKYDSMYEPSRPNSNFELCNTTIQLGLAGTRSQISAWAERVARLTEHNDKCEDNTCWGEADVKELESIHKEDWRDDDHNDD